MTEQGGAVNNSDVWIVTFLLIVVVLVIVFAATAKIRRSKNKYDNGIQTDQPEYPESYYKPINEASDEQYSKSQDITHKMASYIYSAKNSPMSQSEQRFYKILLSAVRRQYVIFPQINFDKIFRHKHKGQSFKGARGSIKDYSVDFILCDPHLQIVCAIELDDKSHDKPDRIARDKAVNDLFNRARLPLVRISTSEPMNPEKLRDKLSQFIEIDYDLYSY